MIHKRAPGASLSFHQEGKDTVICYLWKLFVPFLKWWCPPFTKRSQQVQSCHIKHTALLWICCTQDAAPGYALAKMTREVNQPNTTSHCFHVTWFSASNQYTIAPPTQHLIAQKRGSRGSARGSRGSSCIPFSGRGHQHWKTQSSALQAAALQSYLPWLSLATFLRSSPLRGTPSLTLGMRTSSRLISWRLFGVGFFHY